MVNELSLQRNIIIWRQNGSCDTDFIDFQQAANLC